MHAPLLEAYSTEGGLLMFNKPYKNRNKKYFKKLVQQLLNYCKKYFRKTESLRNPERSLWYLSKPWYFQDRCPEDSNLAVWL